MAEELVDTATTRPCRACCTPIPEAARKCAHCGTSQRSAMPVTLAALLSVAAALALLLGILSARDLFGFPPPLASVSIDQPRMFYSEGNSAPTVSVLGFLSNTNPFPVGDPHFEVRFFDADGDLVDTLSSSESALVIPPRSEAAFRVSGPALREQSEYSRFDIRLTQIARARR